MKQMVHKEKWYSRAALFLFVIYAAVGLFLYDDYGCGPDEGMERQTSLVNYRYIVHKLNIPIDDANETWLAYLPELHEYRDRYYGTALHFPLVLIESLYHFQLEPAQFYGMRHFYTFFWYFIGVLCFYRLLSGRFGSKKYGLIGALMMILTPRFFAESFYNNKDVIFMALYVICTFTMARWFQKRNYLWSVLLALTMALTINTRFNGIIFIVIFLFVFGLETLRQRRLVFYEVRFLLMTLILTGLFFYLFTPNFWEQPIQTLVETLQFNMRHPNHGSDGNLFKGVLVDAARTTTFIPVWILITVPTVYLIFSLLGTLWYCVGTVKDIFRRNFLRIESTDAVFFISGYAAVFFIILTHVTIYNGWRHCYFVYPCIVFFAVYFLHQIENMKLHAANYAVFSLLCVSLIYNAVWIGRNHPYEYVYFAPLFRSQSGSFSGDYWGISSRTLLEYITESDPERMLLINHSASQAGSINRGLLPEEKRKYIELTYDETVDADYYIVCRDDKTTTDIGLKDYEKVFAVTVDSDEIAAVFKRSR